MWEKGWRDQVWSDLDRPWDLIVIGGGITGAGILREAARIGLRVLLVDSRDFASGTSSRSSKLVHGGLRYLKNAQIKLTVESVRERERLLREGRGLVTPLCFLIVSFKNDPTPGWMFGTGLAVYDLIAMKWGHRHYDAFDLCELCPPLTLQGLTGGYRYFDAQTDDARLVLRIIQEAVQSGGTALNYAHVSRLLRQNNGQVCGVVLTDRSSPENERTVEVKASLVINATGAWADELRGQVGKIPRLRKLRGSHLVFSSSRLPLTRAVTFLHPGDNRPVFAFPWEGVTLAGTTDFDHSEDINREPVMSSAEAEYLHTAVQYAFPSRELTLEDAQASFSGVRPVIDTGKLDPSKESREHILWHEHGLLTVTGGKLTTYRRMAQAALKSALKILGKHPTRASSLSKNPCALDSPEAEILFEERLPKQHRLRLLGRFGACAQALVQAAQPEELAPIQSSPSLWAELRWAARAEGVVHLDDLLLRRVRLGLTLPEGGIPGLDRIRKIVQPELGWDDLTWENEANRYADLWKQCYHLPA